MCIGLDTSEGNEGESGRYGVEGVSDRTLIASRYAPVCLYRPCGHDTMATPCVFLMQKSGDRVN